MTLEPGQVVVPHKAESHGPMLWKHLDEHGCPDDFSVALFRMRKDQCALVLGFYPVRSASNQTIGWTALLLVDGRAGWVSASTLRSFRVVPAW